MPGVNCAVFECGPCRRTKGIGIFKLPSAKDEKHNYHCYCRKNELQSAADRCLFHSVHAHNTEDFNSKPEAREAREAKLYF